MTWIEALKKFYKASITNREAAGLIDFARAVWRTYDKDPKVILDPFDWYPWALKALGYFKLGDKFKVDTAFQLSPFAESLKLWDQLNGIAKQLDAAKVPFRAVVDPRGTDKGFRKLAADAWNAMKTIAAAREADPDLATEANPYEVTAYVKPKKPAPVQTEIPGIEAPTKPTTPTSSGGGAFVLLAMLALGSKKKGRGRRSARR